ncbi:hypothetical protein [Actinomadura formosensis]|uniref:hypothetical protein n=1 Tax=Actinomadura formosensis TaxID=60706 RepID=UPI00083397D9|nr:hypothetical protein [Actinomadura formosensis]
MRHPGLKIVHAVMLAVSVLLAFFVLQDLDEEPATGEAASIWILDNRDAVSGAQTARMVDSFARGHRVSVVREVQDFREPDRLLHLYIASGDAGSAPESWARRGVSSFGHGIRTETHPLKESGFLDPRGMYKVYGSRRAIEELRAEFAGIGLVGELVEPVGFGERLVRYAHSSLGSAYYVVALTVVLTVGASVLLSAKGYGVLRLQGMSFPAILRLDLRRSAPFWLIAVAVVTTITLVFLGMYNGFAHVGLFAMVAGGLAGVLCLLSLITHLGALALVTRTGVLRGLKGEVTARPAMGSVYLLRVIAALLVLIIGGAALASARDFAQRQASQQRFAALGEANYIRLPGSRTENASEEAAARVGRWLRRVDERGQVIAIYRWYLNDFSSAKQRLPEGELLFVNDTFLAEQPILDPSGRRYGPDPRGRLRVIIPERLREYAQTIIDNVPAGVHPADGGKLVRRAGVDQVWAKDGQTVFTFGSESEGLDEPLLHDPVLVVIPNGSSLTSGADYTAMATHNGIIFKNPQDLLSALGRDIPREDIADMNPVGQNAAGEYAESARELRVSGLSLTAALVVLFTTGLGVCMIYARKNAQAIFAKHINGWSFWTNHRRLFALDALVACGLLGWVGWGIWTRVKALDRFTARGVPAPPSLPPADWWELAPAAGVAALATILLTAGLAFAHRRIVTEHAADV